MSASQRVIAFVDGFNLYHAICDLKAEHLKWVDLRLLVEHFARSPHAVLHEVRYFSAYATWLPGSHKRHRAYAAALTARGVTLVMGNFKNKTIYCKLCRRHSPTHEEKETDVNIALHLYRGAVRNEYDTALILSGDSDLAPAVRMVKADYPSKRILVLSPPGRPPGYDLLHAAGGPHSGRRLKPVHLKAVLLPREVRDDQNHVVALRPTEYDPPV